MNKLLSKCAFLLMLSAVTTLFVAGAACAQLSGGDPSTGTEDGLGVVPVKVIQLSRSNTSYAPPTTPYWGHTTIYSLRVIGSDGNPFIGPQTIAEHFSNYTANSTYAADLAGSGAPGTPNSATIPGSQFSDRNQATTASWTNPPNADTGAGTFWFSFDQLFTDNYGGTNYTLNTHHIKHYQSNATRAY